MARIDPLGPEQRRIVGAIAWAKWIETKPAIVHDAIRAEAPKDTGALASQIVYRTVLQGSDYPIVRFISRAEHSAAVHQGHGTILPVQAKALAFFWKAVGQFVVTQSVKPLAGNPFMTRALRKLGLKRVQDPVSPRR